MIVRICKLQLCSYSIFFFFTLDSGTFLIRKKARIDKERVLSTPTFASYMNENETMNASVNKNITEDSA